MMSYRPYRGSRVKNAGEIIFSVILVILLLMLLAFSIYRYFFFVPEKEGNTNENAGQTTAPSSEQQGDLTDISEIIGGTNPPESQTDNDNQTAQDGQIEDNQAVRAMEVPFDKINDGEYIDRAVKNCKSGGYNTLVFEVKSISGYLAYKSQTDAAVRSEVSAQTDELASICERCKNENIRTAAKISVFRDNQVSSALRGYAIKTGSGARWLDRQYMGWINPYDSAAGEYICGVAAEIAERGFDEIILDNFYFPYVGKTELINYGEQEAGKVESLEQTASQLVSAVEDTDCELSVILTPQAAKNGEHQASGQSVIGLCEYFGRVYFAAGADIPEDGAESEKWDKYLNSGLRGELPKTEFVPIVKTQDAERINNAANKTPLFIQAEG